MTKFNSFEEAHKAWEQNKKEIEEFYAALRKIAEEQRAEKAKKYDYYSKLRTEDIYFYITNRRTVTPIDLKYRSLKEILDDAKVSVAQFRQNLDASRPEIETRRNQWREPQEEDFFSKENYQKALQNYRDYIKAFDEFFAELRRQASAGTDGKSKTSADAQNDPNFHAISTWWFSNSLKQQFKPNSSYLYTPEYFKTYSTEDLKKAYKEITAEKTSRLRDFTTSKPTKRAFKDPANYENYLKQWQENYDEFQTFFELLKNSIKTAAYATPKVTPKAPPTLEEELPLEWHSKTFDATIGHRTIWERNVFKNKTPEQCAEGLKEFKIFDAQTRQLYSQKLKDKKIAAEVQTRFEEYKKFSNQLTQQLEKASGQKKANQKAENTAEGIASPSAVLKKIRNILPAEYFDENGDLAEDLLKRLKNSPELNSPLRTLIRDELLPKQTDETTLRNLKKLIPERFIPSYKGDRKNKEHINAIHDGVEQGVEAMARILTNTGRTDEMFTKSGLKFDEQVVERGCYSSTKNTVYVQAFDYDNRKDRIALDASVVTVHELGHALDEHATTKDGDRFLNHVTDYLLSITEEDDHGRPKTKPLPPPFKGDEIIYILQDGYNVPMDYMSKQYVYHGRHYASEMTSMTCEFLFRSPEAFLDKRYQLALRGMLECLNL